MLKRPAAKRRRTGPARRAGKLNGDRLGRLRDALDGCLAKGTAGGISMALFQDGISSMEYCIGDLKPDSIVRIASMSKLVTSCCALCLVEEGLLNPTADLTKELLPELAGVGVLHDTGSGVEEQPRKAGINLVQLLTHTSGLSYRLHTRASIGEADPLVGVVEALHQRYCEVDMFNGLPCDDAHTSAEFLHRLGKLPLAFEPGTRYLYSLGIDVAGILIERVTGQTLEQVMRARVFEPLGMKDTHFVIPKEKLGRFAAMHQPPDSGKGKVVRVGPGMREHPASEMDFAYDPDKAWTREGLMRSGGAGLASTLHDYVRLLHGVIASATGSPLGGCPPILSPRAAALLTTDSMGSGKPQSMMAASRRHSMGCGVVVRPAEAGELAPSGTMLWFGIFGTAWVLNVEHRIAAVLMTQRYPNLDEDITQRFSNLIFQALD